MPLMTRIPSDLAAFGLTVELVPGWETRSAGSFAPGGVTCHWTAGPKDAKGRPSLNVVTNGRAGLPGPLCNVYLGRDGTCIVVAAGRANHAGEGGYRGLVGNSAVYGIEAECAGDGDWTPAQKKVYPILVAALLHGIGRDASWAMGHNEWAPTRKIDIRDIMPEVRSGAAAVLSGSVPSLPDNPEDDMYDQNARDELVGRIDQGFASMVNYFNGLHNDDTRTRIGLIQFGMNTLLARGEDDEIDYDKLAAALAPVIAPMIDDAGSGATAEEIADLLAQRLAA